MYQDFIAIVREYDKFDLFITVTCNPTWPEIQNELLVRRDSTKQSSSDRPELVARVFKLKLQAITNELFVKRIFGKVIAHVHVIEFQKRGLPHAYILVILAPENKPNLMIMIK